MTRDYNQSRRREWRSATLGALCSEDRTIAEQGVSEVLVYIGMENVVSGTGAIVRDVALASEGSGLGSTFRFTGRHVLYGKLRPYLNKVALPECDGRCSTELIPLLPASGIDRSYLAWLLRRQETVDHAMQGTTGSRMPRTDMRHLFAMPVLVPPFPEQRRIAAILDEQMAAVARARAAAQARLAAINALPAAHLRQVFPAPGAPLPDGWRWERLGDVCRFINGDAYRETDWSTEGLPIIRIQNLNDQDKPFNYWSGDESGRVVVENGDLLLAWSGTPGTSFGAHIWQRGRGMLNQHIFLVHPFGRLERAYAELAINNALSDLILAAHGAVGLAHVTRPQVEALLVPMPPMREQEQIVAQMTEQMGAIDRARAAAAQELDTINALPGALLRRAFSGEL